MDRPTKQLSDRLPSAGALGGLTASIGAAASNHLWVAVGILLVSIAGRALRDGPPVVRDWVDAIVYARERLRDASQGATGNDRDE
jgi:hypothetical protein